MKSSLTRGVVYVATGANYATEAAQSRASLRKSNPELPAALMTDIPVTGGDWQHVIPITAPSHTLRDKLHMRSTPWDLTLFLDTDTWIAMEIGYLFDLLADGFDLIGHQLFEGHDYRLAGISDAFPEFNTGVIGFRSSAAVQRFFDEWTAQYDHFLAQNSNDQQSFRHALYHSDLRHSVIPPEYNFRPLATNFAIMGLHIIHGRPLKDMPILKEKIDVKLVHRAWVPRLGCVVSDFMTPGQAWRLWLAATDELVRTGTRPLRKRLSRLFRPHL